MSKQNTYLINILEYKQDKYFYIQLIPISNDESEKLAKVKHRSNQTLKLHTFAGFPLYNDLKTVCEATFDDSNEYKGIIDEEIMVIRGHITSSEPKIKD